MSKRKWAFKLTDVQRALLAAMKAGLTNFTVRVVPGGVIEIRCGGEAVPDEPTVDERPNSFDQVLRNG